MHICFKCDYFTENPKTKPVKIKFKIEDFPSKFNNLNTKKKGKKKEFVWVSIKNYFKKYFKHNRKEQKIKEKKKQERKAFVARKIHSNEKRI